MKKLKLQVFVWFATFSHFYINNSISVWSPKSKHRFLSSPFFKFSFLNSFLHLAVSTNMVSQEAKLRTLNWVQRRIDWRATSIIWY